MNCDNESMLDLYNHLLQREQEQQREDGIEDAEEGIEV